jgi:hypothetical protein
MLFTILIIGAKCTGNFVICIGSFETIRSGYSNLYKNIFYLYMVSQSFTILSNMTWHSYQHYCHLVRDTVESGRTALTFHSNLCFHQDELKAVGSSVMVPLYQNTLHYNWQDSDHSSSSSVWSHLGPRRMCTNDHMVILYHFEWHFVNVVCEEVRFLGGSHLSLHCGQHDSLTWKHFI